MAYQPTFDDLPDVKAGFAPSFSDLPPEEMVAPETASPASKVQNGPNWKEILSKVANYIPKPSLPIGLNVASGLASSAMPEPQRNMMAQLPQIATGQPYGLPQKAATAVGSMIPNVMAGGESALGQMGAGAAMGAAQAKPGERMHDAATNALSTLAVFKGAPYVASLFRQVNPTDTANLIQKGHDALKEQAENAFKDVSKGVHERGIATVPTQEIKFNGLRKYFPDTDEAKKLLNDAKTGNYNALRKVQSDLWTKATKNLRSDLEVDRMRGEEMLERRDKINNAISNHLQNTGNHDLDAVLNKARSDFHDLKDIYYSHPTISKLVDEHTREIPENIFTTLKKNSVPLNRLKEFHPDISADINALNNKKNLKSSLKALGWSGGALGTTYLGLRALTKSASPHSSSSAVQNQ